MKGRNTFTPSQIEEIKKLISEKIKATADKQKGIRDKIRKLGFYYSDFSSAKDGYTVSDFETLIRSGQIKVIGAIYITEEQNILKRKEVTKSTVNKNISNLEPTDLNSLLITFKQNRFDPKIDTEVIIPDKPGNYIICLKPNSNLPEMSINPEFTRFDGLKVIYTGIAGGSLRTRDYRQHFKGNNAGRSTLRKSIGVLLGYKQIPRDSDPNNGKTKFGQTDEQKLTEWMIDNLIMYFLSTNQFNSIELKLINEFNPPLNLKDNHNSLNSEFRKLLSSLRSQK
jgi:hypothetical protein